MGKGNLVTSEHALRLSNTFLSEGEEVGKLLHFRDGYKLIS